MQTMIQKIKAQSQKEEANFTFFNLQDYGLELLCAQFDCSNIRILYLNQNGISSQGIRPFNQAKWDNLTYLSLRGNKIRDLGCKYLSRATLTNLEILHLPQNEVGREGALHTSKGQWNLKLLNLGRNHIGIEGIQHILKGDWKQLNHINLQSNSICWASLDYLLLAEFKLLRDLILCYNNKQRRQNDRFIRSVKLAFTPIQVLI